MNKFYDRERERERCGGGGGGGRERGREREYYSHFLITNTTRGKLFTER